MIHRVFDLLIVAAGLSVASAASVASAHFPWLYVSEDSYPRLFFGEGLSEQDYHLPKAIAEAVVKRSGIGAPVKTLSLVEHEEEGYVGLEGEDHVEPRGELHTAVTYGLYHGSKLTYHAQHFPAENPQAWPGDTPERQFLARLTTEGDELLVSVTWGGEPLAGTGVSLTHEDDDTKTDAKTDTSGVARLPIDAVADGLNGLMVLRMDKDSAGELDGEAYKSETHVLTATFYYSDKAAAKVSALPPLPEAIASFGGVVSGDWLYVYSGHVGKAHDHSRDNLSKHFRRCRLDGAGGWEELPPGPALQGLPLVAYGGKLYRVGGLDSRNAAGEEEDMHSTNGFAAYDPETRAWTEMTPLPGPRSSHDAVVIGDTLYVVGGWALSGSSDGDWQTGAVAYDFANPDAGWVTLPEPPFRRRALAVSHLGDKLVVIGGMTDDQEISSEVFLYDPATKTWSEGPEFPAVGFNAFGLSAWNLEGTLYAGGMEGVLYQMGTDGWTKADDFATSRFFHQLVPDGRGGLYAVAGASPDVGRTGSIERIDLVPNKPDVPDLPDKVDEPDQADNAANEASPTPGEASAVSAAATPADRWPQFRGVGTSVSAATGLPTEWSDESGVAWRVDLPGYGQSSPIVWGGKVFVTTMQGDEKETPTVLAFDLATGEELWRQESSASQTVTASNYVSRSAPTPCVDGQRVYAFFESGDLLAFTHGGEPLWNRSLVDEYGRVEGNHGLGGSPVLAGGRLLIPFLHGGPSYLLAVDPTTGKNAWKTDMPKRVAWSTPGLSDDRVVLSGSGAVDAYDLVSGQRLWQVDGLDGNNVPMPTLAGNLLLVGAQKKGSNLAVTPDGEVRWRSDKVTCSFGSPAIYRGRAYFVSRAGVAQCVRVTDGELLWKERLPDSCWASPLAAEGRVYFFGKGGETVVYAAGDEAEKLSEGKLSVASESRVYGVAAVTGKLLVRTGSKLFCLGSDSI